MADTPALANGETANPGDSQTTVQTSATPSVNAVDPAEVERLRKEAEQARLRANQLENEAKARAEEDEKARQKQLEENNEWKQIAEQNKAKVEAYEKEREESEARQELTNASNQILGTFSNEVQEEARELGIALLSTDDVSKEAFKTKLERLNQKISTSATPTASNPQVRTVSDDDMLRRVRSGDRQARHDAISNLNAVKTMREISGYQS